MPLIPRPAGLALAALLAGCGLAAMPEPARAGNWVVYYGATVTPGQLRPYRLAVLDAETRVNLRQVASQGTLVLGYISVGEVEQNRAHFAAVQAEGLLGDENPNWPGSFYVDVRDPRWTRRVVEELVPALLARGFGGVFLDTLDNPPHLERTDPARWAGMTQGAADLVKAIRARYPGLPVMMNRGYDLLPLVARDIDLVLGESVLSGWDFAANRPQPMSAADTAFQVNALKGARALNPALRVMTLDYWDPADTAGVAALYARQRANGFDPYVATLALDRIIPEPPR